MINSRLKIKDKQRDRLFFDRFRYCLHIIVQDFECLRSISKPGIEFPEFAKDIIIQINRRAARVKFWSDRWNDAYNKTNLAIKQASLNDLAIILWPRRSDIKLSLSGSIGYIYSNDLTLLEEIAQKSYVRVWHCKQAIVSLPRDTILLTRSDYTMRSYFKERKLSLDQKRMLLDFLTNQTEIYVTPSLRYWLEKNDRFWTRNYFFIDHNSELIITMMGLVSPGLIGRTFPIVLKDK